MKILKGNTAQKLVLEFQKIQKEIEDHRNT